MIISKKEWKFTSEMHAVALPVCIILSKRSDAAKSHGPRRDEGCRQNIWLKK